MAINALQFDSSFPADDSAVPVALLEKNYVLPDRPLPAHLSGFSQLLAGRIPVRHHLERGVYAFPNVSARA
jgi:hypothetical protein